MKLSEIKGEEAIEVLAELLEPSAIIMKDKEIVSAIRDKDRRLDAISMILKNYSKEVLQILAIMERKPIEEFKSECNVMTLPLKLMEIFNDAELMGFFSSQEQSDSMNVFGSVMENTEEKEAEAIS